MNKIELQKGLNDVVTNTVQRMIDRNQNNVKQTLQRLMSEHRSAQDFIAPIGVELKKKDTVPVIKFTEQGYITMNVNKNRYSLHPHAVGQLAEKMNIPSKYLRQLSEGTEWQRQLATQILNEHSGWTERTRVLVRTVGNQVRGVLSDSYRRLNSEQILTAFLPEAMSQGAVPCDAYMSDTKIWVETILPEPISIPTEFNGTVMVYMGARFSTSDYGDGAVDMRAYLLNGVCLNGMVRESLMKQVHLGSRLPDNLQFSERTYALETETTVSATKDFTKNLYSRDNIMRQAASRWTSTTNSRNSSRQISSLNPKVRAFRNY
jgi:FtsZ-binding cell division protein ZapB